MNGDQKWQESGNVGRRLRGDVMRDLSVTQVNGARAPSVPTTDDLALFREEELVTRAT